MKMMRNRMLLVLLASMLVIVPLLAACVPPTPTPVKPTPTPVKPIKVELGLCHIWALTHGTAKYQFPRWIEMVEKATDHKYDIKLTQYPLGTLVGGAEIYDAVVKGIVDLGSSCLGYNIGRFPVMEACSLAGIGPKNSNCDAHVEWEYYKKFKPKEFADTKVLYFYSTGPGWIHSRVPIRSLEDIQGLEVRSTGASARAIKALGGVPISMPMHEAYIALQKGICKALVSPPETLKGYKHAEVTKYSVSVPLIYTEDFYMVMNWDKWNALPKDLQDAFDAVAEDAVEDAGAIWQYMQKEGVDFAIETTGQEVIELSKEELARWNKRLKPVTDEYIKRMEAKGLPGKKFIDEVKGLTEKYNKIKYKPFIPPKE